MAVVLTVLTAPIADASEPVGTSFPDGFPEIIDRSLGVPVIGFGAAGDIVRTPVIFLHGNNDTPYPTRCNGAWGHMHDFATSFHANGYRLGELWALGYQGDQCDAAADPTIKSSKSHSTVENVPDLRAFVAAVLAYTGADQVDIVGHSLGGTVPREWLRQDDAYDKVRRLVMVDSPHHGIINCSPSPRNYYANPAAGGFGPDSAICLEYGAPDTPLLARLNAGDPTPGPTQYLSIRNADTSFVYFSKQDGVLPPVPPEDRHGRPQDFSRSAAVEGARNVDVTGQGAYDPGTGTAHIGISNSPEVWQLALDFLTDPTGEPNSSGGSTGQPNSTGDGQPDTPQSENGELPATGGATVPTAMVALITAVALSAAGKRPSPRALAGRTRTLRTNPAGQQDPPRHRSPDLSTSRVR